ncbi:UbiA family prenyltransferase [Candidatus Nitrosocosmicus sp. T]
MFQSPYFQLFRISNIFTVPPDIIIGFLAVSIYFGPSIGYSVSDLVTLIFSSVFLYIGGLVLNDLFDIKVDRLERPNRPLPSGRIKKGKAIQITVLLFSVALALASIVNTTALGISMLLIAGIVTYNYKIKNGYFRPYLMAAIRALNVIYGASFIFDIPITSAVSGEQVVTPTSDYNPWVLLVVVASTVYFHIFILTSISKSETAQEFSKNKIKQDIQNIKIIYLILLIISVSIAIIFTPYKLDFLLFILLYLFLINLLFNRALKKANDQGQDPAVIQFVVKNMLILLIVLDSAFIAGVAGILSGSIVTMLTLPCLVLSKKISMT